MITAAKMAIARLIRDGLETQVRIRTSDFEGERDGRPIPQMEVSVIYSGSTFSNQVESFQLTNNLYNPAVRALTFNIYLRVKNLRTEDEVQDLCDVVLYLLQEKTVFNQPLLLASDQPLGYEEGIWTYRIDLSIQVPANLQDCGTDWESLELEEIIVTLHPKWTPDDLTVPVASIKPV